MQNINKKKIVFVTWNTWISIFSTLDVQTVYACIWTTRSCSMMQTAFGIRDRVSSVHLIRYCICSWAHSHVPNHWISQRNEFEHVEHCIKCIYIQYNNITFKSNRALTFRTRMPNKMRTKHVQIIQIHIRKAQEYS